MALTERYVSSAAGGGGDGSSGSPWTWDEMLSSAAAGDRCNVYGTFSLSSSDSAFSNDGTATQPIIVRGCSSAGSITDGYQGRTQGGAGPLDTTNMPAINYSSGKRLNTDTEYLVLESLNFTSTNCTNGVTLTGTDNVVIRCRMAMTGTGGTTNLYGNDYSFTVIDCDCFNTASGGGSSIDIANETRYQAAYGCHAVCTSGSAINAGRAVVVGCVVYDSVIGIEDSTQYGMTTIANCTIYNCTTGIQTEDNANRTYLSRVLGCHITDCTYGLVNDHIATSDVPIIRAYTRYRDNTSGNDDGGFGDWPEYGTITTDSGDAATDYNSTANDDYRLVNGAAGADQGALAGDLGALKEIEAGSGVLRRLARIYGGG